MISIEKNEIRIKWSAPILEELNFSNTESGPVEDTVESGTFAGPITIS